LAVALVQQQDSRPGFLSGEVRGFKPGSVGSGQVNHARRTGLFRCADKSEEYKQQGREAANFHVVSNL
jgi:hypothetical protein